MPREFRLPDLGEGVIEALIIRVLVKEGDEVAEDEYLMEVETDKATVQIPSPCGGKAGKVHVNEGDTIRVGDLLVTFDGRHAMGEAASVPTPAEAILAPKGTVTATDGVPPPAEPSAESEDTDKWGAIRRVPLNPIRKTIANQMSKSARAIPHVTHMDEVNITELESVRRRFNPGAADRPPLTVLSFVVRALCVALRKYPIFNATFDEEGDQIVYKKYVNMGIAVDTERGLIVPVIRNADTLSLSDIARELHSITDRVRGNRFVIEDLRGGTFTVTNLGALGGIFSTPIINHPEVAILGVGRSRAVPGIEGGQLREVDTLPLSLSFDHRVTDGANAARFMGEITECLANPARLLP
jgi:pyruvate dehydrogenase E2 component (dihydrolipoamide acetyltransferase)